MMTTKLGLEQAIIRKRRRRESGGGNEAASDQDARAQILKTRFPFPYFRGWETDTNCKILPNRTSLSCPFLSITLSLQYNNDDDGEDDEDDKQYYGMLTTIHVRMKKKRRRRRVPIPLECEQKNKYEINTWCFNWSPFGRRGSRGRASLFGTFQYANTSREDKTPNP